MTAAAESRRSKSSAGASVLSEQERRSDRRLLARGELSVVGQIYLFDNPLLKVPLKKEHIKPRLLGHWGTTPGLNFIYVHLNRMIKKLDLDMIYITGPGHGGPGLVANAYLEGTYSEVYPNISQDEDGHEAAVHPVLLPRRHSEPCRAGNAGLDPRGRRTRLCAFACLWRRVRQPRSHRRRRGRRRRSRNRPAGDELALQQIPQSGAATAPCCRSCTSTATRSPIRPYLRASRPRSSTSSCAATATNLISSRGTSPRRCTN